MGTSICFLCVIILTSMNESWYRCKFNVIKRFDCLFYCYLYKPVLIAATFSKRENTLVFVLFEKGCSLMGDLWESFKWYFACREWALTIVNVSHLYLLLIYVILCSCYYKFSRAFIALIFSNSILICLHCHLWSTIYSF